MTGRATVRTALAVLAIGTAACGEGESSPRASGPALSISQLVGQRFVFAFPGRTLPRGLARRIRAGEAAGIVIFSRNFRSRRGLRALIRRAQRLNAASPLDAPLLVMVDQEGGETNHVPGPPELSAESVGRADDPRLARAEGRSAGRNLRALGINVNLAPVADVARPGSALQREERTYGQEPAAVGRACGRVCGRHRGRRRGRDPEALPRLRRRRHQHGLRPRPDPAFRADHSRRRRAAVRARDPRRRSHGDAEHGGLPGPRPPAGGALARGRRPASCAGRLGFEGVSITDTLESPALARYGGPKQVARRAAAAGTDLLLFARTYRAGALAAAGLERAASAGAIPRADLEAAARRVLALRARLARAPRTAPGGPGR